MLPTAVALYMQLGMGSAAPKAFGAAPVGALADRNRPLPRSLNGESFGCAKKCSARHRTRQPGRLCSRSTEYPRVEAKLQTVRVPNAPRRQAPRKTFDSPKTRRCATLHPGHERTSDP